MRKILFALVACLFITTSLFAQRTVSGKVTDNTGEGLPGVSVSVKGTNRGTITSPKGTYTITVNDNVQSLVYTFVGYATEVRPVGSESVINVSMKQSDRTITEVVVTSYGNINKNKFNGASTVMTNKVVDAVPVGSFDQALQGRAPGLLVNSGSGQPGTSARVTIRGNSTIGNSGLQPLYVVDGVPIESSDFATLNPNDFETITLLKDAEATAVYGARGGVGVIVITTKRGKAGTANFQFRSQMGTTAPPSATNFNLMNTKEMLSYEEREKIASTPGWNYSPKNPNWVNLTQAQKDTYAHLLDSIGNIDINYADLLLRKGFSQMYELNASGGNDKSRYYFSGSMYDQKGTDLDSRLRRYTARFNLDHTQGRLTMAFNNSVGFSISDYADGEFLGNSARNPFQMVWRSKTYENPYNPDGSLNTGSSSPLALKQIANTLEGIQATTSRDKQVKINSSLNLGFKVLPYLTVKNVIGIDASFDAYQRYVQSGSYYGSTFTEKKGFDMENTKLLANLINTSSVNFSKTYGKHDLDASAFFEVARNWVQGNGFYAYNLDPRLSMTLQGIGTVATTAAAYPQNMSSARSGWGIRSYFANARYSYNGKYTVSGAIRRDGTSRIMNAENQQITTWSVGASWNAIKEDFLANNGIFDDIRVRASYGVVPNIGSINYNNFTMFGISPTGGFLPVPNYMGTQYASYGGLSTPFAGSAITGQRPTSPGNPNLTIEHIKKFNLGLELAFLHNRAHFTADYYRNMTMDMFVNQPLSYTTGFSSMDINAGKMSNRGIELSFNVDVVKQKDLWVNIGINHAYNKNKIEDLGLVDEYVLGTFLIKKGLPFGTHYTYNYLGADPATGKPMYEGADGKTVYDVSQAPQMAKFGSYVPKHVGGLTLDAKYKGFAVSALFSYQFDVVRSNNVQNWITRGTASYQQSVRGSRELLDNQWQKPGDVKLFQSSAYDRGFTSVDLMDAKFLRFRNLNVSYTIPELALKGTKLIKGAKVYVQGYNIAVWSPWKGQDPEDDNNISLNEYPNPKAWVVGIDINF